MCETSFQRSMSFRASASSSLRSSSLAPSASSRRAVTSSASADTGSHCFFSALNSEKSFFAAFWSFQKPSAWDFPSNSAIFLGVPLFSKRVLPRRDRGLQFPKSGEQVFQGVRKEKNKSSLSYLKNSFSTTTPHHFCRNFQTASHAF